MERRDFLIKSSTVFTATMFSCFFIPVSRANQVKRGMKENNKHQLNRRPNPDDFTKPALMAIAFGINAPNPHNTQAWKFKLVNDYEFLFYIDKKRLLYATDPTTRQIHIGCGCFLATLKEGMTTKKYETQIDMFPEGTYLPKESGNKPVARIQLTKSNIESSSLSEAIFTRKTNRLKYRGDIVCYKEFEKIIANIPYMHSKIAFENNADKMSKLIEVLYRGMEIECKTHATYEESRIWFRLGDDKVIKRDGINLDGTVNGKLMIQIMEKAMKGLDHNKWHEDKNINLFLKNYRKAIITSKGLVWFKTATNSNYDWVKTGMDYANFQLAAHKLGIYIHPMSQVLQEYKEMDELGNEFNQIMDIIEPEKIQMIIRIGHSNAPFHSYRRDLNEFFS